MPILRFAGFDSGGTYESAGVVVTLGDGTVVQSDDLVLGVSEPIRYTVSHDTERNRHERRKGDALRRRRGEPPVVRVKLAK